MRVVIAIALVFFTILLVLDAHDQRLDGAALFWYSLIYGIAGSTLVALHFRRVQIASHILVLALLLIATDPTMAYWSPGTVTLGLIFTLLFQLLLKRRRAQIIAITLNLAMYGWVVYTSPTRSPLLTSDYYSDPFRALVTTYSAHLIVLGIAILIRRDQARRNQIELLLEQQRADILRQLISHVSHDLGTPLTKINLKLYLLRRLLADQHQRHIDEVEAYVADLYEMVHSMLESSRLDSLQAFDLRPLPLGQLVSTVLKEQAAQIAAKNLKLAYQPGPDTIYVKADDHYLRLAVLNVVSNAIQYTAPGGAITVELIADVETVQLRIADTGPGIALADQERIFERFYRGDAARSQAEKAGNGMGLAIARQVMELHGGTLVLERSSEAGSVFALTLNRAPSS